MEEKQNETKIKKYGIVLGFVMFAFQQGVYFLSNTISGLLGIKPYLPKVDAIDDAIKIVPFFIIPYFLSYPYWAFAPMITSKCKKEHYFDINLRLENSITESGKMYERKIKDMTAQVEENRKKLTVLEQENELLKSEIADLTKKLNDGQVKIKGLMENTKTLHLTKEKEIDAAKKAFQSKLDATVAEKEKIVENSKKLLQQIKDLKEALEKKTEEMKVAEKTESLENILEDIYKLIFDEYCAAKKI